MPALSTKSGYLVGIGSSAGGLEAMMKLLPRLRPNGSTRFVVAQHLLKSAHNDLVLRVLGQCSTLPVIGAQDGEVIEPDRLYLIPSNWNVVVSGGRIRFESPVAGQLSIPSVNALFESIAQDAGAKAIGIVLSGAGSDGVLGCKAIKSQGGRVLIQTADTAVINGMPGAVERAGLVDELLSPEALADRINVLGPRSTSPVLSGTPVDQFVGSQEFQTLIQEISRASGIDFSSYKEGTLVRRIRGRMKALGIFDIEGYAARARRDPEELDILRQLFVVSLSWFFRDHVAFDKLREFLSTHLSGRPAHDVVRVWVPGCATGEECFSFAILLTEITAALGLRTPVEVIGSDLNAEALDIAKRGFYPSKAFKEFRPPELIAKYFIPDGKGYQVSNYIRALCSFREEDVIAATPPPRLELVSCRNLLIYMKRELQENLIEKFFHALVPDGLLFLGMSENIGLSGAARFTSVDTDLRIFRRKPAGAGYQR